MCRCHVFILIQRYGWVHIWFILVEKRRDEAILFSGTVEQLEVNMATYKDLLVQQQALSLKIEEARKAELNEAKTKVRELVVQYGLTVQEVFPKSSAREGKKMGSVAPKYRDPQTGATWSGRGKAPLWIAGKDRTAFTI